MILLSNHLLQLPEFRDIKDVVIRINLAYVKDMIELLFFVTDIEPTSIFLDYPKDRTKPPVPTLSIHDALQVASTHFNVKYFGVSNIQEVAEVDMFHDYIPDSVKFVPKIETHKGVDNLEAMFKIRKIEYIMLDSEDLYVDVNHDVELYTQLISRVRNLCKGYDIKLFELYGVVFYG